MSTPSPKSSNSYLKYSGMAFEMVAFIALGYYLGAKLDKWMGLEQPICTMSLILLFFSGFIYKLYKSLSN